MKNSKNLIIRSIVVITLIITLFAVPQAYASPECEAVTGNWYACSADFDAIVEMIKAACDGIVPPGVIIHVVPC